MKITHIMKVFCCFEFFFFFPSPDGVRELLQCSMLWLMLVKLWINALDDQKTRYWYVGRSQNWSSFPAMKKDFKCQYWSSNCCCANLWNVLMCDDGSTHFQDEKGGQ
jgi:hypothetical protein